MEEIIINASKMDKTDHEQFVGQFSKNNRKFSVYLTDKYQANRHRFHVMVDNSMSRYTTKFDDKFFDDVELAFMEREETFETN